MARRLYVGNLNFNTSEQMLADAFAKLGTVTSTKIIMDRESGQSRGFGFVEFSTDAEGDSAIAVMNGQELDGRKLTVNEAKQKEQRR